MKKYIEVKENPAKVTHLKIELYYDLGGMNYFTGKAENRGYYLSVTPVTRGTSAGGFTSESYTAFTGIKQNIKQVTRKSAKAETEAEKLAADAEKRKIAKWLEKLQDEGFEILVCTAKFSNGEAIYSKATPRTKLIAAAIA